MEEFFGADNLKCCSCGEPINLWDATVQTIRDNFMLTHAFAYVGAQNTLFQFTLSPEKTARIDFGDFGVPNEARIVAVNFTPGGSLFPLQWHSNQLVENQLTWGVEGPKNLVNLWPASHKGEKAETRINCQVTWVDRSLDDWSKSNLIDAFSSYAKNSYKDAIIPANVAVETMVSRVMNSYLSGFVSNRRVNDFLDSNATYSSQLNVLLPVLAKLNDCPEMPNNIRGLLNRLRGFRNDLAHDGGLKQVLLKDEIAELLAAATFGVAYSRLFERSVQFHAV